MVVGPSPPALRLKSSHAADQALSPVAGELTGEAAAVKPSHPGGVWLRPGTGCQGSDLLSGWGLLGQGSGINVF